MLKNQTIQHQESSFLGVGRVRLYYQSWHPSERSRGIFVLIHGLGSHSDIFSNLVQKLVTLDYAVYGLDLRGHGRSAGQRGYINSWDEFREDLQIFLELIRTTNNNLPIFLVGHSLGGSIVVDYILDRPENISGAIALAPALGKVGVSQFKLKLAKILDRICPRFFLKTGIDPVNYTRDKTLIKKYQQDPLIHHVATARLTAECFKVQKKIYKQKNSLKIPLLILHGGGDVITYPSASRKFIKKANLKYVEFKEYPEIAHDIQNDPDRELVFKDICDWSIAQTSKVAT
ncbi:MAG: alpha/beta hydrolase [Prochloraceae cyanobacterium]